MSTRDFHFTPLLVENITDIGVTVATSRGKNGTSFDESVQLMSTITALSKTTMVILATMFPSAHFVRLPETRAPGVDLLDTKSIHTVHTKYGAATAALIFNVDENEKQMFFESAPPIPVQGEVSYRTYLVQCRNGLILDSENGDLGGFAIYNLGAETLIDPKYFTENPAPLHVDALDSKYSLKEVQRSFAVIYRAICAKRRE